MFTKTFEMVLTRNKLIGLIGTTITFTIMLLGIYNPLVKLTVMCLWLIPVKIMVDAKIE